MKKLSKAEKEAIKFYHHGWDDAITKLLSSIALGYRQGLRTEQAKVVEDCMSKLIRLPKDLK